MKEKYLQILELLQEQSNTLPRLQKIHKIVGHPDFHYELGPAADFVLGVFLKSSYWLDRELFDDHYLYQKNVQNLAPNQRVHLKMVDIGVSLLKKGFPVQYNPEEYSRRGPDQMGPYVKTLVEQIYKKYTLASNTPKRPVLNAKQMELGLF